MPTNIKVAVRVRPLLEAEIKAGHASTNLILNIDKKEITTINEDLKSRKAYRFDRVFSENTEQNQLFNELQINALVSKVVDGYHATIFAYGQTGSGKTYTMEGYEYTQGLGSQMHPTMEAQDYDMVGITQRAIHELFRQVDDMKAKTNNHMRIYCSFLQIYNEKVFDLLNNKASLDANGLRVRWNKLEQFKVENLFVFECHNPTEAVQIYNYGIQNKIVASHNLNLTSSRSHSIFSLTVENVDSTNVDHVILSKLQLVDLAGSERATFTGNATNEKHFKESIDINKSLFTLRKVITSLSDAKSKKDIKFIPYRDSKLTCLLKQSLGGNSYCLMIACLSPSDYCIEENISTLQYATRAAVITNEPIRNEDPKIKLIFELKKRNHTLQKYLNKANDHIEFLTKLTGEKLRKFGNKYDMIEYTEEEIQRFEENPSRQTTMKNSPSPQKTFPIINQRLRVEQHGKDREEFKSDIINQAELDKILNGPSNISERLIDCINMVKELLQSNSFLREKIDQNQRDYEKNDAENYALQIENQDLRDRVVVLENILKNGGLERNNLNGIESPEVVTSKKEFPMNMSTPIIHEMIGLRKNKRKLESRVKQLEVQNLQIAKELNFVGNNEPTRPIFTEGELPLIKNASNSKRPGMRKKGRGSKSTAMTGMRSSSRDNSSRTDRNLHNNLLKQKMNTDSSNKAENPFQLMTSTMNEFHYHHHRETGGDDALPTHSTSALNTNQQNNNGGSSSRRKQITPNKHRASKTQRNKSQQKYENMPNTSRAPFHY